MSDSVKPYYVKYWEEQGMWPPKELRDKEKEHQSEMYLSLSEKEKEEYDRLLEEFNEVIVNSYTFYPYTGKIIDKKTKDMLGLLTSLAKEKL